MGKRVHGEFPLLTLSILLGNLCLDLSDDVFLVLVQGSFRVRGVHIDTVLVGVRDLKLDPVVQAVVLEKDLEVPHVTSDLDDIQVTVHFVGRLLEKAFNFALVLPAVTKAKELAKNVREKQAEVVFHGKADVPVRLHLSQLIFRKILWILFRFQVLVDDIALLFCVRLHEQVLLGGFSEEHSLGSLNQIAMLAQRE